MIKDKLPQKTFFALLILIMLSFIGLSCIPNASREDKTVGGCSLLPKRFSERDLVGTWVAESPSYPESIDTLIIRSDGTYKQIIQLERQIEYESDWQAWQFEYRDNGTGYLHLDDYRTCAADAGDFEASCDWVNDGEIPEADVCEEQWMDPGPRAGENILVVRGIPGNAAENTSRPFMLTLFKGFESSPWSYTFVEP